MRIFFAFALLVNSTLAIAFEGETPEFAIAPFERTWMNHPDPTTIYRSNDYPRAVFVIEGYFKSCPYCNDNAPMVNRLRTHYANHPNNVQIIDMGRDCRGSDYHAWIERHNPNHPVLNDCGMKVLSQLAIEGYPTTYILDCNLNVKKQHSGPWTAATFNTIVDEINALIVAGCVKP